VDPIVDQQLPFGFASAFSSPAFFVPGQDVLLSVGTGDLFENTKRKANRLGVSDRILFLGKCDDAANLYQAMDLFALTLVSRDWPLF
jgi:glycosyltransferase involved in cell wall biosynthesis